MQLRRGLHASLKWRLLIATSPDHFAKGAIFESSLLRTERGVGLQPAGLRDFRDRRAARTTQFFRIAATAACWA